MNTDIEYLLKNKILSKDEIEMHNDACLLVKKIENSEDDSFGLLEDLYRFKSSLYKEVGRRFFS